MHCLHLHSERSFPEMGALQNNIPQSVFQICMLAECVALCHGCLAGLRCSFSPVRVQLGFAPDVLQVNTSWQEIQVWDVTDRFYPILKIVLKILKFSLQRWK